MRWLEQEEMAAWRSFLDAHQLLMTRLDRELRQGSSLGLTEYTILCGSPSPRTGRCGWRRSRRTPGCPGRG